MVASLVMGGVADKAFAAGTDESPAPKLLKQEIEHIAKLDAALAPVSGLAPSQEDAQRIKQAVAAVASNNMERFNELKAAITGPVGKTGQDAASLSTDPLFIAPNGTAATTS